MDGKMNALEFLTMNVDTRLRACPPTALDKARAIAHKAAQLVTAAARANLEPRADDSHSNLGWDSGGRRFVSHPLSGQNGDVFVGFSLSPLRLDVIESSKLAAMLELNGSSVSDAYEWLDRRLSDHGLKPATKAQLPYELPPEVAGIDVFRTVEETDGLAGH